MLSIGYILSQGQGRLRISLSIHASTISSEKIPQKINAIFDY